MRDAYLTHANPGQQHAEHVLIFASLHPPCPQTCLCPRLFSSIHSPRVQHILKTRTAKLVQFLMHQSSGSRTGRTCPLIPRNFIRALGTDIITAFAFSDAEGTNFLDGLRAGANTMQELGMEVWELWHEDKRDSFFFFESQPGFKRFVNLFAPHGRSIHARFEAWVETIMKQYETRVSPCLKVKSEEKQDSEQGVYWRLLTYSSPTTGQPLSWNERASEITDHMGASGPDHHTNSVSSYHVIPNLAPSSQTEK